MLDYINKEIVNTFYSKFINEYDSREFNHLGRKYYKTGSLQNIVYCGILYKVYDFDKNEYVYKLHVGYTKQHPNDKHDMKVAYELSHEHALIDPKFIIDIDNVHKFNKYLFNELTRTFNFTIRRSFIKTEEEKNN